MEQAWHWPATEDLPCCLARTNSYREMVLQETMRSGSLSSHRQPYSPRLELTTFQRNTSSPFDETCIASNDVATYDPRPADSTCVMFFLLIHCFNSSLALEQTYSVSFILLKSVDAISALMSSPSPPKDDDLIDSFREQDQVEDRSTSQYHDPRTAVDLNLSRVSSRMSSVRSSSNEVKFA